MRIPSGTTDQVIYFVALDSTDLKTRETGLSSFTVYRSRDGGTATAMTTPTVTEVDATNMPGVYKLLLDEDTTIASGNDSEEMVFHITQASMAPVTRVIEIYRPKITLGNTLDVTSTGAAGIDWGNVENQSTSVNLSSTTTNLVNTATTLTGHTAQTGDNYARLGAPVGASISADIATVDGNVDTLITRVPDSLSHANLKIQLVTDYGLDHLVSAAVVGTDITDNSIFAYLVSSSATADWDTFVNTTDSLQATRDHIGDGTNLTETGGNGDHLTEAGGTGDQFTAITNVLGTPTDLGGGATLALNNSDMAGATFATGTDSLEAIRNHIGDGTNLTEAGGTGNHLTDLGGMSTGMKAEIQTEVDASLVSINLDHLVSSAVDTDWPTTVHDDSVMGYIASDGVGTGGGYDRTTDSLEAISDSGGGGLTQQQVRDAMTLAPTGTASPAAGSVDAHLDTIIAGVNITQILGTTITETNSGDLADSFSFFYDVDPTTTKTVNDVGVAGSGLTAQQVRDAMKLAPSGTDAPATGSVDDYLSVSGVYVDWSNIQNKTATVLLSNTNIDSVTSVVNQVVANVTAIGGASTPATNLKADYDGTGYNKSASTLGTVTTTTNLTNLPTIPTNWITADGIAAGAIDASAIATNAIDADSVAADAIDLIWDESLTGHSISGSAGERLVLTYTNSVNIVADTNELQTDWADDGRLDLILDSASTLSSQDVRDAMTLAPSGTGIASGSIDEHLDTIETNTTDIDDQVWTAIRSQYINTTQMGGYLNLYVGNIYNDTDELQTDWTDGGRLDSILNGVLADTATLGTPSDLGGGATFASNLSDMAGATFSTSTDSLEAIRNRGDSAWTGGGGGGGSSPQLLQNTTIDVLGSQTSFTLAAGSPDDDAYNDMIIVVTDLATSTQKAVGVISDYVGSTKTVTLASDPGVFDMESGDTVDIIAATISEGLWSYDTRTLTTTTQQIASVISGTEVTIHRGDSLSLSITGLGSIANYTKLWFTVKNAFADPVDSESLIQITLTAGTAETDGLQYINSATADTPGNGAITVDDSAAGDITITLDELESAKLPCGDGCKYDVQVLRSTGAMNTLTSGDLNITEDVTRSTT